MDFGEFVLRLSQTGSLSLLCAFLIGLLAAISPCPLATNITAMAYISRGFSDRRHVATSGALYTLGRTVSYFTLGAVVILAGVSIPHLARLLQDAGERFMGPLLIIVGILLLGIVRLPFLQSGGRLSSIGERVAQRGNTGAFLMGVVFALAFCPNTAVLFFGVLVPLALTSTWGITFPAVFAVGTGLPVLIFAVLLTAGVTKVATWLNKVTAAEKVVRRIAAVVFIGVGIYFVVLWIQSWRSARHPKPTHKRQHFSTLPPHTGRIMALEDEKGGVPMRRRSKLLIAAIAVVGLLVLGISGAAFAASPTTTPDTATTAAETGGWGEPGNGTGPGDMHRWGESGQQGSCWGEPGLGSGPGEMHQWGESGQQGSCLRESGQQGAGLGDPSLCTGPGDMHRWGTGSN